MSILQLTQNTQQQVAKAMAHQWFTSRYDIRICLGTATKAKVPILFTGMFRGQTEFTLKDQNSFTTDFLHLTLDSGDHDDDGAVLLLREFVNDYAHDHGIAYDDAARQLSQMPEFEGRFEALLGEEDGHVVETIAYPSEASSMTLQAILDAIFNGVDGWLARD